MPKTKKPFGWCSKWLIIFKLAKLKIFLANCGEKVRIPNILWFLQNIGGGC